MIENAILLSAGQGSRLLPLTAERPKCLIEFSGRSLIGWQIEMLARGGVKRIDVVTGFMTDLVDAHLAAHTEVDYLNDIEAASMLTDGWAAQRRR